MTEQVGVIKLNQPKNKYLIPDSELLTSLSFLDEGQPFPPESQINRLNKYKLHKSKFDNKLNINKDAYDTVIQLVNDRFRVISYRVLINLYRKVSLRTADFLFVERPKYTALVDNLADIDPKDNVKQQVLNSIVNDSSLNSIGHQGALDVDRFGDAIYTIDIPGEVDQKGGIDLVQGAATIGITSPVYWFPVVSEKNLKKIQYHVMAHVVSRMVEIEGRKDPEERQYVIYQVHSKGSYTFGERILSEDGNLGEVSSLPDGIETDKVETGLSDFAIVPTQGTQTSDSIFGIDSYTDMISLISELEIRMEKIAHVLDKHSDPSLSGPVSAINRNDETGEYYLKMGDYFARDSTDDPEVSYVTWDGKLEDSFKQISIIMELLAIISEMGAAIFDPKGAAQGSQISGRALKLLYVNPLTKVSRIRNNFDDSFKKAISLASEVGYNEQFKRDEISITWRDGLPDDPKEKAEIQAIRLGNRPSTTTRDAVMDLDSYNEQEAEIKVQEIEAENKADIPGGDADHNFMDSLTDKDGGQVTEIPDEEE